MPTAPRLREFPLTHEPVGGEDAALALETLVVYGLDRLQRRDNGHFPPHIRRAYHALLAAADRAGVLWTPAFEQLERTVKGWNLPARGGALSRRETATVRWAVDHWNAAVFQWLQHPDATRFRTPVLSKLSGDQLRGPLLDWLLADAAGLAVLADRTDLGPEARATVRGVVLRDLAPGRTEGRADQTLLARLLARSHVVGEPLTRHDIEGLLAFGLEYFRSQGVVPARTVPDEVHRLGLGTIGRAALGVLLGAPNLEADDLARIGARWRPDLAFQNAFVQFVSHASMTPAIARRAMDGVTVNVTMLGALARQTTLARDPEIRSLVSNSKSAEVLRGLAESADATEFPKRFSALVRHAPLGAVELLEHGVERLAPGVRIDAGSVGRLLKHADHAVRLRALMALSALPSDRVVQSDAALAPARQ